MPSRLRRSCLLVFALAMGLSQRAPRAWPVAAVSQDVVAPLVVTPLASPNPVLGADDKVISPTKSR